jgi:hypothetical protein
VSADIIDTRVTWDELSDSRQRCILDMLYDFGHEGVLEVLAQRCIEDCAEDGIDGAKLWRGCADQALTVVTQAKAKRTRRGVKQRASRTQE